MSKALRYICKGGERIPREKEKGGRKSPEPMLSDKHLGIFFSLTAFRSLEATDGGNCH